jgi:uncharacterized membrane protein
MMTLRKKPLVIAGLVLGIGLGGFADGILFHQILQLHGMLTGIRPKVTLENAEINMFWDGLFHAVTWCATVAGLTLLWRASRRQAELCWSGQVLVGAMLAGWGLFNLVEGTLDHYILGVHHVYENAGLSIWDALFLASGLALLGVGGLLVNRAHTQATGGSSRGFGVTSESPV